MRIRSREGHISIRQGMQEMNRPFVCTLLWILLFMNSRYSDWRTHPSASSSPNEHSERPPAPQTGGPSDPVAQNLPSPARALIERWRAAYSRLDAKELAALESPNIETVDRFGELHVAKQRTDVSGKSGLILQTKNGTPYLYGNLAEAWLDRRLAKLGLWEAGMGWHSFKRFRNSWLRAPAQRCQEDLRKFWLAHKPKDMGELYSALKADLPTGLAEAERVGYGFVLPRERVPNVPRKGLFVVIRKTPATATDQHDDGNGGRVAQLGEHLLCKQSNSQAKSLPRLRFGETSVRLAAPILLQDISHQLLVYACI